MSSPDLIFLKQQTEFLGLKITKEEKKLIQDYARKNKLNQTKVVRLALRDFFQEKSTNRAK